MARAVRKRTGGIGAGPWSEPAKARRLSREQVVQAGLEVLEAEGFDGLTMRALAEKLGIKAASLYNHVADKNELLALMADAICAEMPDLDASRPWRDQAETMARRLREALMRRRDSARVMAATPPAGPNRLRLMEQGLRAGFNSGMPPAKVADAAFVLSSYVIGFVLDETMGQPHDEKDAARLRAEAKGWLKALPKEQFPTLVALADHLIDSPADRRFELGLGALLDGLELRLGTSRLRSR